MTFLNDLPSQSEFSSMLKKKKRKESGLSKAGRIAKNIGIGALGAGSLGTTIQLAAGNKPTPRWLVNAMKKGRFGKDIVEQAKKIKTVGKTKKGKPIYEALNVGSPATNTAGTRTMIGAAGLIGGSKLGLDQYKKRKRKANLNKFY